MASSCPEKRIVRNTDCEGFMHISRACGGGVSMVYLSYIELSNVEEKPEHALTHQFLNVSINLVQSLDPKEGTFRCSSF